MTSQKLKGSCHCKAISFELNTQKEVTIYKCNCSICKLTGFEHLVVDKKDFNLLSGKDSLSEYTFNTKTAKHLFCKKCGVKSFYSPRSHPDGVSVNFNAIENAELISPKFENFDGQNWEKSISITELT